MISRVTLDWDTKNVFKLSWRLFKIFSTSLIKKKSKKEFYPTLLNIKSSNRGYHVFIWYDVLIPEKVKLKMRKYFCDDIKHLNMDKKHKFGRQTLFTKKRKVKLITMKGGWVKFK